MKVIECDVILVNKLTEVSALMEMTESFLRYMLMKESISPKQQQQQQQKQQQQQGQQNLKSIKKLSKDTPKKPKSYQRRFQKMKPAVVCEFDYQYPELKIKLNKEASWLHAELFF